MSSTSHRGAFLTPGPALDRGLLRRRSPRWAGIGAPAVAGLTTRFLTLRARALDPQLKPSPPRNACPPLVASPRFAGLLEGKKSLLSDESRKFIIRLFL